MSAPFPSIGSPFCGGLYAGVIRGANGALDQHLILLDGEARGVSWDEAGAFAATKGGALPTRDEQALLAINLPEHFSAAWYWSSEQHAAGADRAWSQSFDDGQRACSRKSFRGRARAIRRVAIDFNT